MVKYMEFLSGYDAASEYISCSHSHGVTILYMRCERLQVENVKGCYSVSAVMVQDSATSVRPYLKSVVSVMVRIDTSIPQEGSD